MSSSVRSPERRRERAAARDEQLAARAVPRREGFKRWPPIIWLREPLPLMKGGKVMVVGVTADSPSALVREWTVVGD